MIQMRSILDVADNSGGPQISVITRSRVGGPVRALGDTVTASVKEAAPDSTVKKGQA